MFESGGLIRPTAGSGPSRGRGGGARFRPRQFTIRDGWIVVVGRSNEENDYVTHSVAKQEDYWFHASGVPGSHVVLKKAGRKDNPSTKALEEAAAIAAFYSKARNSRKAPVIYTLKKYVRKPRKAKAGLAVCTNEKTIMVAPSDPEAGAAPEWAEDE
ncbi:MAG: NFACT RNA binding domain-containing protein [Candidatus Eisenbacteria bacterium]